MYKEKTMLKLIIVNKLKNFKKLLIKSLMLASVTNVTQSKYMTYVMI